MMISPVCFSGYYIMSADHLETSYPHESAKGHIYLPTVEPMDLPCPFGHQRKEPSHAYTCDGSLRWWYKRAPLYVRFASYYNRFID